MLASGSSSSISPQKEQQQPKATLNLFDNESTTQEFLKCIFCEKFLSVPPIYNNGSDSVCGRCKSLDEFENKNKWSRQALYESMATYMIFPCSNRDLGCKIQLKWGTVEEHENTCLLKKITCPFSKDVQFGFEKCRWIGSGPYLNEHLEICHGDLIKKLPEINFTDFRDKIFLTRIAKQLMIVAIQCDGPDKYSCVVMVNGISANCDSYRYQLELSDENRKNSMILRRGQVEDAVSFEENLMNLDKMLLIDMNIVRNLLKNAKSITGRFGIIKKSRRDMQFSGHSDSVLINEGMIRELECPICGEYLRPPIFICESGHSFCGPCKNRVEQCPTCREPFNDARNYVLEQVTLLVNFPCPNQEAGCAAICSGSKLQDHEKICEFSGTKCFIANCPADVVNMFKHLTLKHTNDLINCGDLHILDISEDIPIRKQSAICFGNEIFRLTVVYFVDEFFQFEVHHFGVKQSNYSYELELVCTVNEDKLSFKRACVPLDGLICPNPIKIHCDTFERFISEDELLFYKLDLKMNEDNN